MGGTAREASLASVARPGQMARGALQVPEAQKACGEAVGWLYAIPLKDPQGEGAALGKRGRLAKEAWRSLTLWRARGAGEA